MRIGIVAVGKLKERYLQDGVAEYVKRLAPYCRLEITEVPEAHMPAAPSAAEKEQTLAREGEHLLCRVRPGSKLVALDVAGEQWSSEELAARIAAWGTAGDSDITFVIGGAFGLAPAVRAAAAVRLSFSPMTFTHQMIRLLLVEQIYRAFKIIRGEPYHW